MDRWFALQNRITPDLVESLHQRYNILRTLLNRGPLGRRSLARLLNEPERTIRTQLDFLREVGFVNLTGAGAVITQQGRGILFELDDYVSHYRGLRDLEERLVDCLGLKQVVVVPGHSDTEANKEELGRFAARFLRRIIGGNDVLAVTGGSTLAALARAMSKGGRPHHNLTVVSGRGGLGEQIEIEANTIAVEIARALGGGYRLLYLPDNITDHTLRMIKKEPAVAEIIRLLKKADILVHGIGAAVEMARRRQLDADSIAVITERGGKGEACGYYFNSEGEVIYTTPSVGLVLEDLHVIKKVVAVAGGAEKAAAIRAVVKPEYQDILITDEAAAEAMLKMEELGKRKGGHRLW